jgi:hypothetical protein
MELIRRLDLVIASIAALDAEEASGPAHPWG